MACKLVSLIFALFGLRPKAPAPEPAPEPAVDVHFRQFCIDAADAIYEIIHELIPLPDFDYYMDFLEKKYDCPSEEEYIYRFQTVLNKFCSKQGVQDTYYEWCIHYPGYEECLSNLFLLEPEEVYNRLVNSFATNQFQLARVDSNIEGIKKGIANFLAYLNDLRNEAIEKEKEKEMERLFRSS